MQSPAKTVVLAADKYGQYSGKVNFPTYRDGRTRDFEILAFDVDGTKNTADKESVIAVFTDIGGLSVGARSEMGSGALLNLGGFQITCRLVVAAANQ